MIDLLWLAGYRDGFDTLVDHAPEKLSLVQQPLINFINRYRWYIGSQIKISAIIFRTFCQKLVSFTVDVIFSSSMLISGSWRLTSDLEGKAFKT
jgi:hypothetical protein